MGRLPTNRPPTHPGEMLLKEFLEPLGISQASSLGALASPGRGSMSSSTGSGRLLRIRHSASRVLGMAADFWLGLQLDWDPLARAALAAVQGDQRARAAAAGPRKPAEDGDPLARLGLQTDEHQHSASHRVPGGANHRDRQAGLRQHHGSGGDEGPGVLPLVRGARSGRQPTLMEIDEKRIEFASQSRLRSRRASRAAFLR